MNTINRNIHGDTHLMQRKDGTCYILERNGIPVRDFKTGSDRLSMERKFKELTKFNGKDRR